VVAKRRRPRTGAEVLAEIERRAEPFPPGPAFDSLAQVIAEKLQVIFAVRSARDETLRDLSTNEIAQIAHSLAGEIDWAFDVRTRPESARQSGT
jgi:hypothetical protein